MVTDVTGTGTITAAEPGDTAAIDAAGYTGTYDSEQHDLLTAQPTVTGAEGGTWTFTYSLEEGGDYGPTIPRGEDAGSYTVYVKATNPNYSEPLTTTVGAKIDTYKLTADLEDQSKTFDNTADVTDDEVTVELLTPFEGDDVSASIDAADVKYAQAGVHSGLDLVAEATSVVLAGDDAKNYVVTDVTGTGTITAQSIDPGEDPDNPDNPAYSGATVNTPNNVQYNGQDQAWLPTVIDGQGNTLIKDVDYTVSYDGDTKNVRHIVVTITGIGDYEGTITREYDITPATIIVTANSLSKTQGQADPALTSTYEGNVAGEIPGWTGYISRAAGEAPGTYPIGQNTLQLADGENGFLANNYTLEFRGATFTINPLPGGGGDGGDGGDGGTTPTGPTPTPTNPTPGPGATTTIATGVATGVIAGALTDDAADAETIDDDETPLASGTETIDDDATPLASGREDRQCWVHWFMFIGMAISAVYYIGALIHRRSFTSGLKNFEDEILNPNDQNNA